MRIEGCRFFIKSERTNLQTELTFLNIQFIMSMFGLFLLDFGEAKKKGIGV